MAHVYRHIRLDTKGYVFKRITELESQLKNK